MSDNELLTPGHLRLGLDGTEPYLTQGREEFLVLKTQGFVGRTPALNYIQNFVQNSHNSWLVIFGLPGIGKSALVAKWIQDYRISENHLPLVFHFISRTGLEHELYGLLLSLAQQMHQLGILSQEPCRNPLELQKQVQNVLEKSTQKFIILIDALDQLEEAGKNIAWLPRELAPGIKLILATQPVRPWADLSTYPQLENFKLPALTLDEMQQIIHQYNTTCKFMLEPTQEAMLIKRSCGNPLYLKVALPAIQNHKIQAKDLALSVEHLFEQIIEGLYEQFGQPVIQDFLGLLIAVRVGLTEQELREILTEEYSKAFVPISLALFERAKNALQHLFLTYQGIVRFFHPDFARLIRQRFGKFSMRSYHRRLAFYLQSKGLTHLRSLYELPYHLQFSEQYVKVLHLLTNRAFLESKCEAGMLDDLLKDFVRALSSPTLALPASANLCHESGIVINRETLIMLHRGLMQGREFLSHPTDMQLKTIL